MSDSISKLLREPMSKETKQEHWAMVAAMSILAKDPEIADPDYYVAYGLEFAETMARSILMDADIKTTESELRRMPAEAKNNVVTLKDRKE